MILDDKKNTAEPAIMDPLAEEMATEDLGELVFESALLQYTVDASEAELGKFEAYVEHHSEEENFMENLCAKFSEFEKLLVTEIKLLEAEMEDLTRA